MPARRLGDHTAKNAQLKSRLANAEYSPEIEHGFISIFVHKHVLSVSHSKPVQHALHGLEPSRDPGPSRSIH